MSEIEIPRRLVIRRDPDRARLDASEETITATGVQFPSGNIEIEWRREAFKPDDRSEGVVGSRYTCVEDARQATAGFVEFIDEDHEL